MNKFIYSNLYAVLKDRQYDKEKDDSTAEAWTSDAAADFGGYNMRNYGYGSYFGSYFGQNVNPKLYNHLYSKLNLNSPDFDDGPSLAPKGASMAQQARAAGYQDIYRDIQADRDSEYRKELKDGQLTPEFSGLRRPGNLSGTGYWFNR